MRIVAWALLAVGLIAFSTPAREKFHVPLTVKLVFSSAYDQNILKYSSYDLDRFKTNTEPFPAEITTADDWVNSFGMRLYREFDLGRHLKFRPYYSGAFLLYTVNQVKNYSSHQFMARLGYRSRAYLTLKYLYMPNYYLRIYKDRDWNAYQGARFDLARPSVELRLRQAPFALEGEIGRELAYYDSYFTEYDSEALFWNLTGLFDGIKFFEVSLGYGFKDSDNIGFQQKAQASPVNLAQDTEYGDASYQEDRYNLRVGYRIPLRNSWDWRLALDLQRNQRYYQSRQAFLIDPFHVGRQDRRERLQPSLMLSPVPYLDFELQYTYERRRTASPDPTVSRLKNFDDQRLEFTVVYQLF